MLDFDQALELMKKYGFSSAGIHPYIYQNGDSIGICYTYNDEDFGNLERTRIFDNLEEFEEFLKEMNWFKNNALNYHVRMILDNYQATNPRVIYLRNEKTMLKGEMFNIDDFDFKESQRAQMDDTSKVLFEAGDLLLVYDEMKQRQKQYLSSIVSLKNTLRQKYFDLQKEVDIYNKVKVERHLTLLPDITDNGIDETMEIAIKDRYNMYIAQRPSYEEAVTFLKDAWSLNNNLELNSMYYKAMQEENEARNEIKIVDMKLDLMRKLNDEYRPLFGVDLVSKFKRINSRMKSFSSSISDDTINQKIESINKKYSYFDDLDLLYTSDYLREGIQNTNYDDLAIKYHKNAPKSVAEKPKTPLNEVASSLSIQYRDKLDVSEQSMLVLYNNHKYRKLFNAILEVDEFNTIPIKKLISKINNIKGYSKVKSECFDLVKKRIDDPINATIKNSLFNGFDFTSYETFLQSVVNGLVKLRNVNNKMVLNGDINMYFLVNKQKDLLSKKFVMVTNDITRLKEEANDNHCMVGITLLKETVPVLYSPYYFDIGDIYTKGGSLQMFIKEMVDFDLLIEVSDVNIAINDFTTKVTNYYSEPTTIDNVQVVNDIKKKYNTIFCKYIFYTGIAPETVSVAANPSIEVPLQSENSQQAVDKPVQTAEPTEVKVPDDAVSQVEEVKQTEKVDASKTNENKVEEPKKTEVVLKAEERKPDVKAEAVSNADKKDSSKDVSDEIDKFLDENKDKVSKDSKTATVNKEDKVLEKPKTESTPVKTLEVKENVVKKEDKVVEKTAPQQVKKEVTSKPAATSNVTTTKTPSSIPVKKPAAAEEKKVETSKPVVKAQPVASSSSSLGKQTVKKVVQTVGSVGRPAPVKKVVKQPTQFASAPTQNKDNPSNVDKK